MKGKKQKHREMHEITCADCGQKAFVPLKPRPEFPAYCRECNRKHDNEHNNPNIYNSSSIKAGETKYEFTQLEERISTLETNKVSYFWIFFWIFMIFFWVSSLDIIPSFTGTND